MGCSAFSLLFNIRRFAHLPLALDDLIGEFLGGLSTSLDQPDELEAHPTLLDAAVVCVTLDRLLSNRRGQVPLATLYRTARWVVACPGRRMPGRHYCVSET